MGSPATTTSSTTRSVPQHVPILSAAAGEVGDPQVRHRGTLGGSLAHGDPASDLPAVVLALRGSIVVRGSGGERVIAADDFFLDFLETALAPDEIITEVRVPKTNGAGWAFEKFNRRAQDWAIVGVAAVGGDAPGVALVNMGSTPVRADAVEAALRDRRVSGRRRGRPPTRAPIRRPTSTRRPSTAATWRGCSWVARSRPSQGGRPMTATTFGAGSLVGVPVRRVEDPTLLRGEGTYIDNLDRPRRARTSRSCGRRSRTPRFGASTRATRARCPAWSRSTPPTTSTSPTTPA